MKRNSYSYISCIAFLLLAVFQAIGQAQSLKLRFFPKYASESVLNMAILEPDKAIATLKNRIIYFNGKSWQPFTPKIPEENVLFRKIKVFSEKNIWVFYSKHKFYYHQDCYHFDGKKWHNILLPQPFHIKTIVFIDPMRFFAAGGWGSLLFFDGKKAKNIRISTDVHISYIFPFSEDFFYAYVKLKDIKNKYALMEYKKGRWQILTMVPIDVAKMRFLNSDSGYAVDFSRNIFKYKKGRFRPVNSFHSQKEKRIFINRVIKNKTYFWMLDTIWDASKNKIIPLRHCPFYVDVFPLSSNQFLLRNGYRGIYYLGDRTIGREVNETHPFFGMFRNFGGQFLKSPAGAIGVAFYLDKYGNSCLYFTRDEESNSFYVLNEDKIHNAIFERGLKEKVAYDQSQQLWDSGVFFADMDNDGDQDAIMTFLRGKSYLFENMGNDRFEEVTGEYNFKIKGRVSNIIWWDLNNDGALDFVAGDKLGRLYLEINNGLGKFRNRRQEMGIPDSLIGFNPALADVDNDGDVDLFLYGLNNPIHYFENTGINPKTHVPHFEQRDSLSPQLTTRFDFFTHAMRFGDYDNDGDLDLILVNRVTPTKFFENIGGGKFVDISFQAGFNQRLMGYGANWGDLDQDGYLDIFVTTMGRNYIFWNHRGKFFSIDSLAIPLNDISYSVGSILADLDNDGDLDIVVANYKFGPNCVYSNLLNKKNFLKIRLQCLKSNRDGIGSKIYLYPHGFSHDSAYLVGFREITTNTGYASSKSAEAYFGCKAGSKYDVLVKFPSGITKTWYGLDGGHSYCLKEGEQYWHLILAKHQLLGLILKPRKRQTVFRLAYFILLIMFFNLFIRKNRYWPYPIYFFFNSSMIIVEVLMYLILNSSSGIIQIPIYLFPVINGIGLIYLMDKSITLRYGKETREELFRLLKQMNHTKSGMKQINHLIFFLNNITVNPELNEDLIKECNYFADNTLVFVQKIATLTALWNFELARKSDILKLNRYFFHFRFALDGEKRIQEFKTNLLRLKKSLLLIKREIEREFHCNVLIVLNEVLLKFPEFNNYSLSIEGHTAQDTKVVIYKQDLVQILENLFQNALEAMINESEKRLSVKIKQDYPYLKIYITNWGETIPPEHSEEIFQEYYSGKGSSGLGLFHVKQLLTKYGGDILLLESHMSKGTTFEISLREYENEEAKYLND